jgi:hypothetical protein
MKKKSPRQWRGLSQTETNSECAGGVLPTHSLFGGLDGQIKLIGTAFRRGCEIRRIGTHRETRV